MFRAVARSLCYGPSFICDLKHVQHNYLAVATAIGKKIFLNVPFLIADQILNIIIIVEESSSKYAKYYRLQTFFKSADKHEFDY